jgi:hypothetical protein
MKRALVAAVSLGLLSCLRGATPRPGSPAARFVPEASDPACLERVAGVAPQPSFAPDDAPVTVRACDGQQVFETAGATAIDETQLGALNGRVGTALVGLPGVRGVGIGGCCPAQAGQDNLPCLHVYLSLCTTPVEDILRAVTADAHAHGLDGTRVTVGVEIGGAKGPRCPRDDDQCWPTPYAGATYWPDRGRNPVHEPIPELGGLSGGHCEHDGECVSAGCGNHCVPWHAAGFIGTCEGYTVLEPAFCGCEQHQCTWFTQ